MVCQFRMWRDIQFTVPRKILFRSILSACPRLASNFLHELKQKIPQGRPEMSIWFSTSTSTSLVLRFFFQKDQFFWVNLSICRPFFFRKELAHHKVKTLLLAKRRLEAANFEVEMDGSMVALGDRKD